MRQKSNKIIIFQLAGLYITITQTFTKQNIQNTTIFQNFCLVLNSSVKLFRKKAIDLT